MGNSTSISWTDATWNPVRGCSRVSAGCVNCYAEKMAARFSDEGQPFHTFADRERAGSKWTGKLAIVTEHLADPLRWQKPRRIFVNSMSDLFHEKLSNEDIAAVFGVMAATPRHTFQVLTKRATRMREWFEWLYQLVDPFPFGVFDFLDETATAALAGHFDACHLGLTTSKDIRWPLPNVWIGVSVEDQEAADTRIPELLATPAAIRFLSCEPLIGPVDLGDFAGHRTECTECGRGVRVDEDGCCVTCGGDAVHWGVDWVIAGCESGTGARDCDVGWLRSLRDQCTAAETAFFLKQAEGVAAVGGPLVTLGAGAREKGRGPRDRIIEIPYLDGVQHAAFPEAT